MADGATYPADIRTLDGVVRESGNLVFTDSTNQPSPGGSAIGVASAFAPTGLTGATQVTRYVGGVATVAPTTGTFAIGDYVVSRNGKIFVCTVAGSPGTWVEPASLTFAPLASPTFTGTVVVPAAAAATSAPQLDQLTSALTITSGALPTTGAWTSTTAQQNPTTVSTPARQVTIVVEFVTDASNTLATCAIAVSADNSTYSTVGTLSLAQALNNLGAVKFVSCVPLPAAWWIKLTFAQGTVAASKYY